MWDSRRRIRALTQEELAGTDHIKHFTDATAISFFFSPLNLSCSSVLTGFDTFLRYIIKPLHFFFPEPLQAQCFRWFKKKKKKTATGETPAVQGATGAKHI